MTYEVPFMAMCNHERFLGQIFRAGNLMAASHVSYSELIVVSVLNRLRGGVILSTRPLQFSMGS